MRNTKKTIVIFIIVCMALTLLPATAFGATLTLSPSTVYFGNINSSSYSMRIAVTVTATPTTAGDYVWSLTGPGASKFSLYAAQTGSTGVASQTSLDTVFVGITSSTPLSSYDTAYVQVTLGNDTASAPIQFNTGSYYPNYYYGGSSIYSNGWNPVWLSSLFWETPQTTTTQPAATAAPAAVPQTQNGTVTLDNSGVANGIVPFQGSTTARVTTYDPDNARRKLGTLAKDTDVSIIGMTGNNALIEYVDRNGDTVEALVKRTAVSGALVSPIYGTTKKQAALYDIINNKYMASGLRIPSGERLQVTALAGGYLQIGYNGATYYIKDADLRLIISN